MTELTFRFAVKEDVSTILYFIRQLAEYERMSNEVVATEELLEEWIFEKQKAEVLFAVADGKEIGFACSSITSQPFSAEQASTWKTCSYFLNTAEKDTGRLSCQNWQRSLWNGAAADWNGAVWTGTNPALISICHFMRFR